MKAALLIIDVQNRFFKISPETAQSLESAIVRINEAVAIFRERKLPVITIQHRNDKTGLVPGSDDFAIPEKINFVGSDIKIIKTYKNSFHGTPLAERLREWGTDTVILSGFCAEHCVLHTYCGAQDCDFKSVMLKGGLAGTSENDVHAVEQITETIEIENLPDFLANS